MGREAKQSKKQILAKKYGFKCFLCDKYFDLFMGGNIRWSSITFEHVKPVADGGTSHLSNLRLAHQKCNAKRGVLPVHVFQKWAKDHKGKISLRKYLVQEGFVYNMQKHRYVRESPSMA